jgi:PKD repeat protein
VVGCVTEVLILSINPTPSITSTTGSDVTCFGANNGSITIIGNGGLPPYSFSQSLTDLGPGNYTVTMTDANGCQAVSSNIEITQPSQISLNSTIHNVLCPGGSGSIDLSVSGGVGPYDVIWNNTINSEDLPTAIAGNYNALITDINGCDTTLSLSVINTFASPPILTNLSGTTELTCAVTSITIQVDNALSYTWSGGLSASNGNTSFDSPDTYLVSILDTNNCPVDLSATITQNITPPIPVINNLTGTTELTCSNPSISLEAAGGTSYQWSNGLGTTATQTISTPGNYVVTVTGANSCTANASVTITSNQVNPTAGITNNSASATLHCNQTSINLTATGGGTYNWSNGLGTSASQTITTPGTYTVTVTAPNGCTDQESITIIQSPDPTVSVTDTIICSGSSGTLTATPSSSGGTFVWTQFPTNAVIPGNGASLSVSPTSNSIYNVQYIDTNNCPSTTMQATVTVNPTPVVTLNGPSTVCSGNSVNLTANTSLSGATGFYTWSPNVSSTSTANVSPNATTTYSVYYTLNGCPSNTANKTITVYQTPSVTVNNVGVCTGSSGTLTATTSAIGGTYSWNTTPIQTTQSITVQPTTAGAYTYSVVYTAPNNCTSTQVPGIVTVTDMPTIQLADIDVCEGQTGTLTAVPSASGGTFLWTPGNIVGNIYTITPAATTSVSVIYTLNGCSSMPDSADVTVISIPSVSVAGISLCQNQTGTLTAIPSVPGGTYLWSTNETTTSINVNPQTTTDYSVIYSYAGCPSLPAFATVNVDLVPVISFDADILEGCSPLKVNFTNTSVNPLNCVWNLGNGTTFNECGSISYTYQQAGCYDISLITDSPNGCTDTLFMEDMICVQPTPLANFTVSTNILSDGNNTVYIDNNSEGAVDYIWNYGDNQIDSSLFSPESHTYEGILSWQYIITLTEIS